MEDIKYYKLNQDDIMAIVNEVIAEKTGIKNFSVKSLMLGNPSKDLRMVVAVGGLDSKIQDEQLIIADENMDYNGEHSHINGLSDNKMIDVLDKIIQSGEF